MGYVWCYENAKGRALYNTGIWPVEQFLHQQLCPAHLAFAHSLGQGHSICWWTDEHYLNWSILILCWNGIWYQFLAGTASFCVDGFRRQEFCW